MSQAYFRLCVALKKRHPVRRLESLLLDGLESGGEDIKADQRFWSDLRAEAAAPVAKRKKRV